MGGKLKKLYTHVRVYAFRGLAVHKETTLEYIEREKEGIIIKRKRALVH